MHRRRSVVPGAVQRQGRGMPWWIWLSIATLLGLQALGQVHRIAHRDPFAARTLLVAAQERSRPASAAATESRAAHAMAAGGPTARHPGFLRFSHEDGSLDCRLFDQLALGDPATVPPAPTIADTPAPPPIETPLAGRDSTCVPVARARGPPLG